VPKETKPCDTTKFRCILLLSRWQNRDKYMQVGLTAATDTSNSRF